MAMPRKTAAQVEQIESPVFEQAAPVKTEKSATINKAAALKKKQKPEAKKDKVYSVLRGGGIWYKIRQDEITYFDEELGYPREIRYSPNQKSAFVDEQVGQSIREHVVFENGMIKVPYTKPNLAQFLDLHPDNVANGGKVFKLVDTTIDANQEVEKEFKLFDAIKLVKEKSIEELLPIAMTLGINTDQSNMEIKRELLKDAKKNPDRFIQLFDNPIVEVKSTILLAIDFQIIKAANDGMRWHDTNRIICATPVGKNTVDVFTSYCMTQDGEASYLEIKKQLASIA